MRKNILIVPSWYPHPDDKINGSFFQEQAKLVSEYFDVKVLYFRFTDRPSISMLYRQPCEAISNWLRFIFQRSSKTLLPDDEFFINPPLIEYKTRIIGFTQRQRYQKRIDAYVKSLDHLITLGWKPDLVHAHSVDMGGLVAMRIKEVYGIPYVITEHIPFALNNYPKHMHKDVKDSFKNADLVLSLGYDKVRQLGMSNIDVEPNLIFNFVDESVCNKLCSVYVPGQILKLIAIGAASHYKDHRSLLRAVIILKERGIPFVLTLIGLKVWGELYDETLEFIQSHDLAFEVVVIDRVERSEIPNYLAAHNVLVTTSIQEGFPVSVLEALSSGLYVIATRHGGTEDILTPEMGSLVEIKNFKKIADRLEDIYTGRITYKPEEIRQSIVSICGREAFRERLIKYYEQAMGCQV